MRPTRILYIENDPILRKILGAILAKSEELELIGSFNDADEITDRTLIRKADVALIDFALDHNGLNGIELGISLRNINEYLGIVIYSQNSVRQMVNRVPRGMRNGWSFFDKSAEMELEDYVKIIKETSDGKGNWSGVSAESENDSNFDSEIFFELTSRQRLIMSLTAQSKSAKEIAIQLDLSYSYIRKELSRAYAILLPEAQPGSSLKTAATLKYMALTRKS